MSSRTHSDFDRIHLGRAQVNCLENFFSNRRREEGTKEEWLLFKPELCGKDVADKFGQKMAGENNILDAAALITRLGF